jgi:uncharacterized protein YjbI with pentapeptide repeats
LSFITRRQEDKRKLEMIRRLASADREVALDALSFIRAYGWLYDGTLVGANLAGASLSGGDLSGADLRRAVLARANLREADISEADLEGADFFGANLEGANLTMTNLQGVYLAAANLRGTGLTHADLRLVEGLVGARLPDGQLYDGRYNLPGDHDPARLDVGDRPDAASMAAWYGVTLEQYLAGQAWAKEND